MSMFVYCLSFALCLGRVPMVRTLVIFLGQWWNLIIHWKSQNTKNGLILIAKSSKKTWNTWRKSLNKTPNNPSIKESFFKLKRQYKSTYPKVKQSFEPHLLRKLESLYISRRSRPEVFCKKGVLRNVTKLTGKHLCQSLFFNKGLRP